MGLKEQAPGGRIGDVIANCPHCFTRALLTVDEPCPTCRKIVTRALLDENTGLTTITLDEGSAVPDACFLCDRPRTKVLKVHIHPRSGAMSVYDVRSHKEELSVARGALFRFILGLVFGRILVGRFDEDPGMRVYIPSCDSCEGRVRVCSVNSRDRSITVIASERFVARVLDDGEARSA